MCVYKKEKRKFHGGLVVRIWHCLCHGPTSVPVQGTELLQAVWHGQNKKEIILSDITSGCYIYIIAKYLYNSKESEMKATLHFYFCCPTAHKHG